MRAIWMSAITASTNEGSMKYKILLSLLVVSVLGCSVADAQYSSQKQTIATDVQEHLDYWKPVTDWIFSWKGAVLLTSVIFIVWFLIFLQRMYDE